MRTTQQDESEILFHFFLDQAAAHMQAMTVSLPLTKQVAAEFRVVRNTMNRIWRIQDRGLEPVRELFESQAAMLGDFVQLFFECEDHEELLNMIRKHNESRKALAGAMVIERKVVDNQKNSLHEKI